MPYLGVFPNRGSAVGLFSGVSAGSVAVLVAHPVDTVKVRMQAQTEGHSLSNLRALLKNPWYGIMPHYAFYVTYNALRFGGNGWAQQKVGPQIKDPTLRAYSCGAIAGVMMGAGAHPFFNCKIMQQATRTGLLETAQTLARTEGVRGLYRAYPLSFFRFGAGTSIFFGTYDELKRRYPAAGQGYGTRALFGATAGLCAWLPTLPLDVLQSRISGELPGKRTYTGIFDCLRKLYAEAGMRAFTRGLAPVLVRSTMVNALLLPLSDYMKQLWDGVLPDAEPATLAATA